MLFLSVSAFSISEALDSYVLQLLSTGKGFLELVNGLTSETVDQSIRHQLPSKLPNFLHDSIANRSLSSIYHWLFSQLSLSEFNQQFVWTIYQPTNLTDNNQKNERSNQNSQSINQSINQSFNQLINFKMSKSYYYIVSIVDHGWMYFIKAITGAWPEIF